MRPSCPLLSQQPDVGHPSYVKAKVTRARRPVFTEAAAQATATPASSLESPLPFHLCRHEVQEEFRLHFAFNLETPFQQHTVSTGRAE